MNPPCPRPRKIQFLISWLSAVLTTGLVAEAAVREPAVQIGEPTIIHGTGTYKLSPLWPLFRLHDGSLLLAEFGYSLRSTDHGKTWITSPAIPGSEPTAELHRGKLERIVGEEMPNVLERRDGSVYLLDRHAPLGNEPGVFVGRRARLRSADQLALGLPVEWREISVSVPQWKPVTGDDGTEFATGLYSMAGPILELADGTMLLACYGNFIGDGAQTPGFVPTAGQGWFKYRTYVLKSDDGGESWRYLSTVAYDGETGQESFCEPTMVDLGGGELLAVMRTGRFAPMHQARSTDGGKTWQKPESMRVLGLGPQMKQLANGALVCTFGWRPISRRVLGGGRPTELALADYMKRYRSEIGLEDPAAAAGEYVIVSFDKGRTWSKPQQITTAMTYGYTELAPLGPDACLVLSRRIVIPGLSNAEVIQKYLNEWADLRQKGRLRIEARTITVRPGDSR